MHCWSLCGPSASPALALFFLPLWFLIGNALQPCWKPLGQPLLFLSRFLITCTCDLWLVIVQVFNQACSFQNYFYVSLQFEKIVMEEKCLWCMVMRIGGAMLFIIRNPFKYKKSKYSKGPGWEHAPSTASQTEGAVQQKDQKKLSSTEMKWQHGPYGEWRRTTHSSSTRVKNTHTGNLQL